MVLTSYLYTKTL